MSWLQGKTLSYILFAAAIVVVALSLVGFISEPVMLSLIGVLGFGGISALRAFIDSTGYKTYISAGLAIIGVIAQAIFPTYVSPDVLQQWLALWGTIAGVSTTQAVVKAQKAKG